MDQELKMKNCQHEKTTGSSAVVTGTKNTQCTKCGFILINANPMGDYLLHASNNHFMNQKYNNKLFEYIYHSVREEGGDGDIIVGFRTQNYLQVADEFEIWLKTKLGTWTRDNQEDCIVFTDNQEYFVFTNEENFESI